MIMEELTRIVTDLLQDNEKHHAEIAILKTKYIAIFAAARKGIEDLGGKFELDETYLNELLDQAYAGVPYATEAQVNGDLVAADYERLKAEQVAADVAAEIKVISNNGEVAEFSDGVRILRQRPNLWPSSFTQPCIHKQLSISTTAIGWPAFSKIFAVGNTLDEVQKSLWNPDFSTGTDGKIERK